MHPDPLLAAVLADPHDDLCRLVYADALDDAAGVVPCPDCVAGVCYSDAMGDTAPACSRCAGSAVLPDANDNRAEFIRVQVEIARLERSPAVHPRPGGSIQFFACTDEMRRRERELFGRHKCDWFGERWAILYHDGEDADQFPDVTAAVVRRGFVAEVRLTLAAFLGGPCLCTRGPWYAATNCPTCSGTGRTPGVARDLFARHPVTRVSLVDREPALRDGSYWWIRADAASRPCDLPYPLFSRLPDRAPVPGWNWRYPTSESALAALSAACVAHGRSLAGLPAMIGASREPAQPLGG